MDELQSQAKSKLNLTMKRNLKHACMREVTFALIYCDELTVGFAQKNLIVMETSMTTCEWQQGK